MYSILVIINHIFSTIKRWKDYLSCFSSFPETGGFKKNYNESHTRTRFNISHLLNYSGKSCSNLHITSQSLIFSLSV